jgi:hypothetical protein
MLKRPLLFFLKVLFFLNLENKSSSLAYSIFSKNKDLNLSDQPLGGFGQKNRPSV